MLKVTKQCFLVTINILSAASLTAKDVEIGSKVFIEGIILSEILKEKMLAKNIIPSEVRALGGTAFLWGALTRGEIDLYFEYTKTLWHEIFAQQKLESDKQLVDLLASLGLCASKPMGFNSSYGLGMQRQRAQDLKINTISDLKKHKNLVFYMSHEFYGRHDGFFSLKKLYQLSFDHVSTMEHSLTFKGVFAKTIDIIDIYTTEAEIEFYDLVILKDDLGFFKPSEPIIIYRQSLKKKCPACIEVISSMVGTISQKDIKKLNQQVLIEKKSESMVARSFLALKNSNETKDFSLTTQAIFRIAKRTKEHILLVFIAMILATFLGVLLGVLAYRIPSLGSFIVIFVSILQTIPALALLVLMMPFFGIGMPSALVAIFFYALLPIVRNTISGLLAIPKSAIESAAVIGLSQFERLRKIEVPMASRHILGGIRTATIITVGTATLGALIGAGGYGQPILEGIRLFDMNLILEGAIPAAVLALLCQLIFYGLERQLVPKGIRLETGWGQIS
jgi:osmoprotectant transport system permease protein